MNKAFAAVILTFAFSIASPQRLAAEAATVPFLAYLEGRLPALVAYSPSGADPRRATDVAWPAASIEADLRALRPAFDGLVLYAVRPDMTPSILAAAAAQGYRAVLIGLWDPRSPAELAAAAALIRQWQHRLALAVCLGNEGLSENRYQITDLRHAYDRLRQLLDGNRSVPITTSEPAGDYGWAPLRDFGDFLAPNVHPAIDRPGLSPEAAVAWVLARAVAIADAAGRPVLVKETGLPHGGATEFTPARQRQFWHVWLRQDRRLPANTAGAFVSLAAAFEAFDAPWKAAMLGSPIEGSWGLMRTDRRPYPAFEAWAALTQHDPQ